MFIYHIYFSLHHLFSTQQAMSGHVRGHVRLSRPVESGGQPLSIIIPMGGSGADFAEAGFRMPKPLVTRHKETFNARAGHFSVKPVAMLQEKSLTRKKLVFQPPIRIEGLLIYSFQPAGNQNPLTRWPRRVQPRST